MSDESRPEAPSDAPPGTPSEAASTAPSDGPKRKGALYTLDEHGVRFSGKDDTNKSPEELLREHAQSLEYERT